MVQGPGIVGPASFPPRNPAETHNQVHGRIVNCVQYPDIGGFVGPMCWPKGNAMKVEKPTSVRAAIDTTSGA